MPRIQITPGQNMISISYKGNGVDDRFIDLGFPPQLVIIKSESTAQYAVFKTDLMGADESAYWLAAAANITDSIQGITGVGDGVKLGAGATTNASGVIYHMIAISKGDANFSTFTYTGNGTSQDISLGYQPDFVFIKRNGTSTAQFKDSNDTSTTSHQVNGSNVTDCITAIISTGFSVAANAVVNSNGAIYHGFAMKEKAGQIKSGTYTGDGIDDRDITGVGFDPAFVMIKNHTTSSVNANRLRFKTFPVDTSSDMSNNAITTHANTIQNLITDGFQVGTVTMVNTDTNVYHYLAIKTNRVRNLV